MEKNIAPQLWPASGTLNGLGHLMQLALGCNFSVQDSRVSGVDFAGVIESSIDTLNCPLTGNFVVDPGCIAGLCFFTLISDSNGVSLTLSNMESTAVYGTFTGEPINDNINGKGTGTLNPPGS